MSFVSSPLLPESRRNTTWDGMAHASDWYLTLLEGVAGGQAPANTGPRPLDGLNLWSSIVNVRGLRVTPPAHSQLPPTRRTPPRRAQKSSTRLSVPTLPRVSVKRAVSPPFLHHPPTSADVSAITINEYKLIRGNPGDSRTLGFPAPSPTPVPLGKSGAVVEPGTDHVRSPESGLKPVFDLKCVPYCLFDLSTDLGEQHDLANDTRCG